MDCKLASSVVREKRSIRPLAKEADLAKVTIT
jgi:hypothetical protein